MKVLIFLVLVGSLLCIQPVIAKAYSDECGSAADQSALKRLCQDNTNTNFWFEQIEGDHAVYWQFNEVYDTAKETIANFATRLTTYVAEHRIGKLILGLRLTKGGTTA